MKKILLTIATTGLTVGAFGQGQVVFENASGSGNVTLMTASGPDAAPSVYKVALLWNNGTSYQQLAVYQPTTANGDGAGYFYDGVVNVPTYAVTGSFEVQGWASAYASYAAAQAAGAYVGETAVFVTGEGNPNAVPIPGTPDPISGGSPAGGWNGDLILVVPEPSTIALGGLGAAALLLFRRKK